MFRKTRSLPLYIFCLISVYRIHKSNTRECTNVFRTHCQSVRLTGTTVPQEMAASQFRVEYARRRFQPIVDIGRTAWRNGHKHSKSSFPTSREHQTSHSALSFTEDSRNRRTFAINNQHKRLYGGRSVLQNCNVCLHEAGRFYTTVEKNVNQRYKAKHQ